jgi:AcrR family transcriptional regulator
MLREKIIDAAAHVYAELGFRGATTRRIAERAGVNEVSLFRHFGSKEALIAEVVRHWATAGEPQPLPEVPRDPERELGEWATAHLARLRGSRSFIRKTMGEVEERPEMACLVCEGAQGRARQLKAYMIRLGEHGFVQWASSRRGRDEEAHAAGAMLMSALFNDALGRDMMPEMYPQPAARAAELYVKVFLRAIACDTTNGRRAGARGNGTSAPATGTTPKAGRAEPGRTKTGRSKVSRSKVSRSKGSTSRTSRTPRP